MGYHVSILRTKGGQIEPITRDELDTLVASIPGLRIGKGNLGDADLVISQADRDICRLTLQHGELWTKTPSEEEVLAMINLAPRLNARVRGDELETYRTLNDWYLHPDDEEAARISKEESRRAIKRGRLKTILVNAVIFVVFFLMALLVARFSGK